MQTYQSGSLRRKTRKSGQDVWEFRYRDSYGEQRQKTFPLSEYPNMASVKIATQSLVFSLNDAASMTKSTPFGLVVERFIVDERLREILAQPVGSITEKGLAYATANRYMSTFRVHILPRWANTPIDAIRPADVLAWIKEMRLSGVTKGGIKAVMHMLFERAMLWDLLEIQRNPIELVKLKGVSARKKKKFILTVEQFQQLRLVLPEPYKTMATVAICTGLRVSELTALRWEHMKGDCLLVQSACYNGRIGEVKTQASADEIPLLPEILAGLTPRAEGYLFPSPTTGAPYDGGSIRRHILRPLGRKLFGVDNLGWHSFRHTYRSLLDGEPVGVQQKLMRHANVSTTMNVYGASAMSAKREANSKVVQMVVGRIA